MAYPHHNSCHSGAYDALMMAQRDAQKIEALQKSLESRKATLEALLQSTSTSVASRSEADEEFKRLIKLMSERIKDLQDEIRQFNRMVCLIEKYQIILFLFYNFLKVSEIHKYIITENT